MLSCPPATQLPPAPSRAPLTWCWDQQVHTARAGTAFHVPSSPVLPARSALQLASGASRDFSSAGKPVTPIKPKYRPQGYVSPGMSQSTLKVACLQLACGADKKKNIENAASKIREAAQAGAELVVLPECFNSPYGTKYFPEYAESVVDGNSETCEMLSTAARDAGVFLVGGSFPERDGDSLYNSCYIFNKDGDMVARHRKVHLFDIDIPGKITFKESDVLSPGEGPTVVDLSEHGGPPVRMGIGICYDIRFGELATVYRQLGCNLLVYPGAFNMVTGPAHWELLIRSRSVDTQSFGIVCSPARDEAADYIAWGHSMIVDPWGDKLQEADEKEAVIISELDLTQVVTRRTNMPYWLQKRPDVYKTVSPFVPDFSKK
jgi:omega-amidase